MEIIEPNKRSDIDQNKKLVLIYTQLEKLLTELRKKELTEEIEISINNEIVKINSISDSDKKLRNQITKSYNNILRLLEKELKIVIKNHYRNTWLAIGMATFGVPLGVAFGAIMDNMGLLGIGLPIGMAIGLAVGTAMDKKAFENGKQLDLEM